jgi:DNA-binding transcriptional regulator LsrR (DeoR family)
MNERTHLMIKVAKLHYESGLTQDAISRQLRISRPTISRLMQDAIDQGIVKITITQDSENFAEIEKQLCDIYDLIEVIITDVSDPDSRSEVSKDLGVTAAYYFSRMVKDGDVIGLTWGTTLSAMVDNLKSTKIRNVMVVQLVGGLGEPNSNTHATDLVHRVSLSLGATVKLMPAPGIVSSVALARLLRSDRYIASAIEEVSKVDIVFAGIGGLTKTALLVRDETIITWSEVMALKDRGAVGEIGLHFYDIQGNLINSDLEERIIGIKLEDMKSKKRTVAIAGGTEKFDAILGAARGRLFNTLITDIYTARRLLDASKKVIS